jgi:SAM-dependent methyltransferase
MQAFGPLATLFLDTEKPQAPEPQLAWFADALPINAGTLLAPMCGSGSLLVPLVAAGLSVHGVDLSPSRIAACEARLAAANVTTPVFRQDITQLNLPFRYAAAFIAGGALQLITDAAAVAGTLSRLHAHLVDPGLLLLECYVPAESRQRLGAPLVEVRTVKLADGTQIALRSESTCWTDARLLRTDNRYAHRRGAQRLAEEHETLTVTWYPPDEIADIVRTAGFRDVEILPSAMSADAGETFVISARI